MPRRRKEGAPKFVPPTGFEEGHVTKRYTVAEAREHLQLVEQLMIQGTGAAAIARVCKMRLGIGAPRCAALRARVTEAWSREDSERRGELKAAQARRLQGYIQQARGRRSDDNKGWAERPDYQAIGRFESLLADLHGTREPIKIDLTVQASASVMHVISAMTPEQVNARLQRYVELKRLAEERQRDLEALPAAGEEKKA